MRTITTPRTIDRAPSDQVRPSHTEEESDQPSRQLAERDERQAADLVGGEHPPHLLVRHPDLDYGKEESSR